MAKITLKKMPKAPKKSASIEAKEAYLKRLAEVKAENRKREARIKKNELLNKKIAKAISGFKKSC